MLLRLEKTNVYMFNTLAEGPALLLYGGFSMYALSQSCCNSILIISPAHARQFTILRVPCQKSWTEHVMVPTKQPPTDQIVGINLTPKRSNLEKKPSGVRFPIYQQRE